MKHRLFIAIDLPDLCRAEIAKLQSRFEFPGLPVVWEKPVKLHLTLNFLGQVPDDQLSQVKSAIHQAIRGIPPFSFSLPFLETLYQRHEESLVYLSPGKNSQLNRLQSSLSQALSAARFPQPRRFLAHVTIGRLKRTDPPATKRVLDQVRAFSYRPPAGFIVDRIILYESLVSRAGSYYQKTAQFMLQSNPSV